MNHSRAPALLRDAPAALRSAALSSVTTLGIEARRALGGLLSLVDDREVQDVLVQVVDGAGRLWVDRAGELAVVDGWEVSAEAVQKLAVSLIAAGGRHLDQLHPCADVHLGGGMRAHAVLPPVAQAGAAVSIRLPSVSPPSFDELVQGGLCGAQTAARLRTAIAEHRNLLVTGGTATGKTTLLAALLSLAPERERIITIEAVAELRLTHPHQVSLEARQPNSEGAGEIGLERLLKESLRMRPDRIVLGECRGAELVTMLSALNTGHDGGAATMHASRLSGVPARLEALGALAGLSPAALHLIVHLERAADGQRRVAGLGRLRLVGDALEVERVL